jgi:RHS repeat-associated protein
LQEVDISFSGTNTSALKTYGYDPAGNLIVLTAVNASGPPTTEVRQSSSWPSGDQVNNLNQIMRNDVTIGAYFDSAVLDASTFDASGALTTSRYSFDASGNLTAKTPYVYVTGDLTSGSSTVSSVSSGDLAQLYVGAPVENSALPAGTTVASIGASSFTVDHNATSTVSGATITVTQPGTTYAWDEDNRLTLVTLPSGATIAYTYDMTGRMLARTDSSGTTVFEWDRFDCIRESAPETGTSVFDTATFDSGTFGSSGLTLYYVVQGRLFELCRDSVYYAVVSDALGSVRLVLDTSASTVSHFEYDAWGNLQASSADNLPAGGMMYRYVGAYGCRFYLDTGLTYMRQRWYDVSLQRFASRDAIHRVSTIYTYSRNKPATLFDPMGLDPLLADPILLAKPNPVIRPFVEYDYPFARPQLGPETPFDPGPWSSDAQFDPQGSAKYNASKGYSEISTGADPPYPTFPPGTVVVPPTFCRPHSWWPQFPPPSPTLPSTMNPIPQFAPDGDPLYEWDSEGRVRLRDRYRLPSII